VAEGTRGEGGEGASRSPNEKLLFFPGFPDLSSFLPAHFSLGSQSMGERGPHRDSLKKNPHKTPPECPELARNISERWYRKNRKEEVRMMSKLPISAGTTLLRGVFPPNSKRGVVRGGGMMTCNNVDAVGLRRPLRVRPTREGIMSRKALGTAGGKTARGGGVAFSFVMRKPEGASLGGRKKREVRLCHQGEGISPTRMIRKRDITEGWRWRGRRTKRASEKTPNTRRKGGFAWLKNRRQPPQIECAHPTRVLAYLKDEDRIVSGFN